MYEDDEEFSKCCKTEFIWPAVIAIFLIVGIGGLALNSYAKKMVEKKAIERGLEECPMMPGVSFETIWVKDCNSYINNYNNNNKNEGKK